MIKFWDLLLGWLLGMFSPLIVDRLQQGRRTREFKRTVLNELKELQYKMGLVAYRLFSHLCVVRRDFLSWLLPVIEAYDGPERNMEMLDTLRKSLSRSDAELLAIWKGLRTPDKAVRVAKYSLPFLEAQLDQLSACSMDFQRWVLQIRAQLELFNTGVELAGDLLMMTFNQAMTGENRAALETNLEDTYDKLANRAADIAKMVSEVPV